MFNQRQKKNAAAINDAIEGMNGVHDRVNQVRDDFTPEGLEEPEIITTEGLKPIGFSVLKFGILGLTRYDKHETYTDHLQAIKRAAELPGPHIVLPVY